MEHRRDLEEILLSGLSDDERHHVVETINTDDELKLDQLQAQGIGEQARADQHSLDDTGAPKSALEAS